MKWAGLEAVRIENGTNKYYNGATAGGVEMTNTAFCWVRDVETNGALIGGIHIALHGAYRCVVRDSHLHHSAYYGFGADCYGICLIAGAADNLVENNIVRFVNKPLQFSNSGGGNVVAYNYADNAWSSPAEFQEVAVDAHCAYPHMELVEGNWAPHLALPETHGNSGYITFFRNYASSQYRFPAVVGTQTKQTSNVQALSIGTRSNYVSAVGNVLGPVLNPDSRSAATITQFICDNAGVGILSFTTDGTPSRQTSAYATAWLHGNYDTVNRATQWKAGNTQRIIPASLYLSGKPAWWPAGNPWPWTGPDLSPMVGPLPAKTRADALAP
ncbi:MAG: hypothetical protein IPL39_11270 [Opitutaceae bacterium]|nr:hypothetical protein [Opitutaceae bacterium]